jgi:hypothetical protein
MEDYKKETKTVAQLLVICLENKGVKYVFGITRRVSVGNITILMVLIIIVLRFQFHLA